MITVLTLCSANYLAQAKTLGDSLLFHNPSYKFVIGLVDRIDDKLDSYYWEPYELIELEQIGIPELDKMSDRYNIVELNTAVKPFYMEYLYQRDPNIESVIYLDPDIFIYNDFKDLENKLKSYNIIITPHSFTMDNADINIYYEKIMLRTGLYNLGFIATARSEETFRLLNWWKKRLEKYCFYQPGSGLFVDQIWGNFIPLYFEKVYIEKNPGYNVCYWNFFERSLSYSDDQYWVNSETKLTFFHFSGYNPLKSDKVASRGYLIPENFQEKVKLIYENYRQKLLDNNYENLIRLECYFITEQQRRKLEKTRQKENQLSQGEKFNKNLKENFKQLVSGLPNPMKKVLKKVNTLILDSL
ncbi:hypothetical protein VB715_16180 [Crocosphaera sp. UHCC 0190]|uniref:hypothetical protein n=1 Tax=Crocosphaera sp. UHCC 0190 TaxID=3110246 RepID=UPI002B21D6EC|nr:hypothetical protein [Crocosphaera sp. UHCC 0190]MEA5511312.1 hypothetical protein [Crocosphaera sp. UHCC 0190]